MNDTEKKKGYSAHAKYLRVSPTKVRRIADNLRKKSYSEAIAVLEVLPHKSAVFLKKVITSAASNALYNNKQLDEDMLYIKKILVNEGPRMKRLWMRARGRADVLLKRMCHIYVEMDEIVETGANSGTKS